MGRPKVEINPFGDGYRFEIYPCNNHQQPIGWSPTYSGWTECRQAMEQFHTAVITEGINSVANPFVYSNVNQRGIYPTYYIITNASGKEIFFSRKYSTKTGCRAGLRCMHKIISEN